MGPVAIAGAAMLGGTAVGNFVTGLMAARDAKRINQETYERFAAIIDQYQKEMDGLLPPGTVDPITLEQLKAEVQKFDPKLAEYTPEKTPQQVLEGSSAEEMQAQKEALRQYGQLAKTGYDPIAAAQQEAALSAGAAQASVARQAALREAAQRGIAGTGLEALAGMGAAEQAGVEGRQAALQAQAEAGQRRLQALGAYGNLAGQMRQQATGVEQANVGIMNAFNERMARNLNQYNQYVAEMKNQADAFNLQNQQRRDEQNVALRNQQLLMNVQRQEAAAEARRAARERVATNKFNMQTGLGQEKAKMEGQELYQKYAPYEQALSTIGKLGSMATEQSLKNYYSTGNKNKTEE